MEDFLSLSYSLESVLRIQLDLRKQKNTNYSLRAFARDLKVSPSTVSKILNGKYDISDKLIVSIATNLSLSAEDIEKIIFFEHCRRFSVFLTTRYCEKDLQEDSAMISAKCHQEKSIMIDKQIVPDILYFLNRMNSGFFQAINKISSSPDICLSLENKLNIKGLDL